MDATHSNGQTAVNNLPAKTLTKYAADSTAHARFTGTDNPRHLRVIPALMTRPRRREDVDDIAGCSNGPDLIAALRCMGLEVPCDRIKFLDRDGNICRPGIYSFTEKDRRQIWAWQARVRKGTNGKRS